MCKETRPVQEENSESDSLKEQKIKEWSALLAQPLPTHIEGLGEDLKNLDFHFKRSSEN